MKQPRFSIQAVLDGLQKDVPDIFSASMSELRAYCIALFAIYLPSRASELAYNLRFRLSVFGKLLCDSRTHKPLADVVEDEDLDLKTLQQEPFFLGFMLIGTKGDRKGAGVPKFLPHSPALRHSPALALLVYLRRRFILSKHNQKRIPNNGYVFAPISTDSFTHAMSDRGMSMTLQRIAARYCGVETGARGWRAEATTFIKSKGASLEEIAQRGGWFATDTILTHYLREKEIDENFVASVFGTR